MCVCVCVRARVRFVRFNTIITASSLSNAVHYYQFIHIVEKVMRLSFSLSFSFNRRPCLCLWWSVIKRMNMRRWRRRRGKNRLHKIDSQWMKCRQFTLFYGTSFYSYFLCCRNTFVISIFCFFLLSMSVCLGQLTSIYLMTDGFCYVVLCCVCVFSSCCESPTNETAHVQPPHIHILQYHSVKLDSNASLNLPASARIH